jgi:hypothetical protein
MRLNVYTIFDVASGAYMRPFFLQSDGQAMRAFTDIATDAEHDVGAHPEDYSLFRIGTYDDNRGQLVPEDPECLATALEVVASSRNKSVGNLAEFQEKVAEVN